MICLPGKKISYLLLLPPGKKADRLLTSESEAKRPPLRCQPENQFQSVVRFNPLASEYKTAGQFFFVDVRVNEPPGSNLGQDELFTTRLPSAVLNSYSSFELNEIFPKADLLRHLFRRQLDIAVNVGHPGYQGMFSRRGVSPLVVKQFPGILG